MEMRNRSKGRWIITAVLILLGLGLLFYPFIASKYNARHQSLVAAQYHEVIKQIDDSELEQNLEHAQQYNTGLQDGRIDGLDPSNSGYAEQLVTPDGAMAVLRIPSIDVEMPIYHGVDSYTMTIGAGHMPNTSLPIGGEGTHCAVSSHSGLASHRGFTDLPDVAMGDLFYVDVLNQTLTYQVTDIQTVLPHEVDCLNVVPGEDLFSLITCVPIAVNSHRLVVTGTRVPDTPASEADATASIESTEVNASLEPSMEKSAADTFWTGSSILVIALTSISIVIFSIIHKGKK